jgi:hypothetical protein
MPLGSRQSVLHLLFPHLVSCMHRVLCRSGLFLAMVLQNWRDYSTLALCMRAYAPDTLISLFSVSLLGSWVAMGAAIHYAALWCIPTPVVVWRRDLEATRCTCCAPFGVSMCDFA